MPFFAYDSCIGCDRHWDPNDQRKGHVWWPLRDQEVQRWCCYRCIEQIWHKSGSAADIGPCAQIVADTLQKQEFYDEIRHLLEMHKLRTATEPISMDVDEMDVDI